MEIEEFLCLRLSIFQGENDCSSCLFSPLYLDLLTINDDTIYSLIKLSECVLEPQYALTFSSLPW